MNAVLAVICKVAVVATMQWLSFRCRRHPGLSGTLAWHQSISEVARVLVLRSVVFAFPFDFEIPSQSA